MNKLQQWFSVKIAKKPSIIVLLTILIFNVLLVTVTALLIGSLNLKGTENMGFFEAIFYTISMIFDAGCISYVVADIGHTSVIVVIICLVVTVVGMITFTGAVIGYVTTYISTFIEKASEGQRKINVENHIILINWNNKGSEIVNDLLYKDDKSIVIVLVKEGKKKIEREIEERIANTIEKEGFNKKIKKKVNVLVREGDMYSYKQLRDISCHKASTVIILDSNNSESTCKYEVIDAQDNYVGNSETIKSLMQIADICSASDSADNQVIIVESSTDWIHEVIVKIADYKTVEGKCKIIALPTNMILGNILAQLTIMPDLNFAFDELMSYKGSEFYCEEVKDDNPNIVSEFFDSHRYAIPLGTMNVSGKKYFYSLAEDDKEMHYVNDCKYEPKNIKLKPFSFNAKNVVVLGHNHNYVDIFNSFMSYYKEWNEDGGKDLSITVIDDKKSVERNKFIYDLPIVKNVIVAEIYEKDLICEAINTCLDNNKNTNILILSDDLVSSKEIDANALTNLIYVQDVINNKKEHEGFNDSYVDIIVEIVNPKHYDLVRSYSIKNVVISNQFISKMIMQIGQKDALYEFYKDILTYDDDEGNEGKEVYAKQAQYYFEEIPQETTAFNLIRDLYYSTKDTNPTILLGYVAKSGKTVIFGGNQDKITVKLEPSDKLIVYSEH